MLIPLSLFFLRQPEAGTSDRGANEARIRNVGPVWHHARVAKGAPEFIDRCRNYAGVGAEGRLLEDHAHQVRKVPMRHVKRQVLRIESTDRIDAIVGKVVKAVLPDGGARVLNA